jgi:hypothetical protein
MMAEVKDKQLHDAGLLLRSGMILAGLHRCGDGVQVLQPFAITPDSGQGSSSHTNRDL